MTLGGAGHPGSVPGRPCDIEVDLTLDAESARQHAERREPPGAGFARHPSLTREPLRVGLRNELVDAHAAGCSTGYVGR